MSDELTPQYTVFLRQSTGIQFSGISLFLWTPEVHDPLNTGPIFVPSLSHFNTVDILWACFKNNFDIIISSTPLSPKFSLSVICFQITFCLRFLFQQVYPSRRNTIRYLREQKRRPWKPINIVLSSHIPVRLMCGQPAAQYTNSIKKLRLWQELRYGKNAYKHPSASAVVIFKQVWRSAQSITTGHVSYSFIIIIYFLFIYVSLNLSMSSFTYLFI